MVVVVAGALLFALRHPSSDVRAGDAVTPIPEIAHRVEGIRGLRFRELPQVRRITRAQLKQRSARALDSLSRREREAAAADHELAVLLGFEDPRQAPANADQGSEILGFYDPPSKTLTIVTDANGDRTQAELTYAHELTHALEDRNLQIDRHSRRGGDDQTLAYHAAAEGSAHMSRRSTVAATWAAS